MVCIKEHNQQQQIVADKRCHGLEKPQIQVLRCNVKPCEAQWVWILLLTIGNEFMPMRKRYVKITYFVVKLWFQSTDDYESLIMNDYEIFPDGQSPIGALVRSAVVLASRQGRWCANSISIPNWLWTWLTPLVLYPFPLTSSYQKLARNHLAIPSSPTATHIGSLALGPKSVLLNIFEQKMF